MSKAYKDVCPCKDCDTRTIICHGICKEYKDWQKSGVEIPREDFFDIRKKKKRRK